MILEADELVGDFDLNEPLVNAGKKSVRSTEVCGRSLVWLLTQVDHDSENSR